MENQPEPVPTFNWRFKCPMPGQKPTYSLESVGTFTVILADQLVKSIIRLVDFQIHLLFLRRQTEQERLLDHVQYLDWSDHGVPMSATNFLEYVRFTQSFRRCASRNDPFLVHCSAGIGRTGAFILLDTSLHLLEMNQMVDPISLVKIIIDQRPMMLQTSVIRLLNYL